MSANVSRPSSSAADEHVAGHRAFAFDVDRAALSQLGLGAAALRRPLPVSYSIHNRTLLAAGRGVRIHARERRNTQC